MTEPVGGTPVEPVEPVEPSVEVVGLQEQLKVATERLNKYDGERKDYSEQTNLIEDLKNQVESLKETVQNGEIEDTKHLSVTQEEMREYKSKEGERFAQYTKDEAVKTTAAQEEYQKHLVNASMGVKDEALFAEICKEHDALVASGGMPESTGNSKADAEIAWRESENSLFRKKLALGSKTDFKKIDEVEKPVVPGQQELSTPTLPAKQNTTMPENLPDDAREFAEMMGMGADSVNKGLAR